ncbi:MAG TPA: response regulator transcription factor [Ilumatobacteraceae bacterium]|nr:response regulator transcription factor [Ilumatobacteraceae bacterium]
MHTATRPAAIPTRTTLDQWRTGADAITRTTGCLLVVAEHSLLGAGLRAALIERGWVAETTEDVTECEVIERANQLDAQCVLLDVHLGGGSGNATELIRAIAAAGAKVVVLTAERRRTVLAEWLEAGAAGWIRKSADLDEVDSTLTQAVNGEAIIGRTERSELLEHLRVERIKMIRARARFDELTPREALVLSALADGHSADEIAEQHYVALNTVRSQIRAVLQKLGVNSQLAAVAIADRHRWLLPSDAQSDRDRRSLHAGRRES